MKKKELILFSLFPIVAILNPLFVQLAVFNQQESTKHILLFFLFVCLLAFLIFSKFLKNKNILYAYLSIFFSLHFDLQFNFSSLVNNLIELNKFKLLFLDLSFFISLFILFFLCYRKFKNFLFLTFIFLCTSLLTSVVFRQDSSFVFFERPSDHKNNLSNKEIYIMFDGLAGPEAINKIDSENSKVVLNQIDEIEKDFDIISYNRIFSIFYHTHWTMSHLFNFDFVSENNIHNYLDLESNKLYKNLFFDLKSNYSLNVFQTDQLNYCDHKKITNCYTLNPYSKSFIGAEGNFNLTFKHNIQHFNAAIQNSSFSKYPSTAIIKLLNYINESELRVNPGYYANTFSRWFDFFTEKVISSENGNVFFAHFMVPHDPYFLTENCNFTYSSDTRLHLKNLHIKDADDFEFLEKLSAEFQKDRLDVYELYLQQTSCVYKKVREMLVKLDDAGILENTSIMIFGDHGSRISGGLFYESTTNQDLIDNHSAAFLVKHPKAKEEDSKKKFSLQRLFSFFINDADLKEDNQVSVRMRNSKEFKFKKYFSEKIN